MGVSETALFELIGRFALAPFREAGWLAALQALARAVDAETTTLELANLKTGEMRMECPLQIDSGVRALYEERVFAVNPRVQFATAAAIGDLIDDRRIPKGPHDAEYRDWLRLTPTKEFQGAKILNTENEVGFLSSHYGKSWSIEGSGANAASVHKVLLPHVINAVAINRELAGSAFGLSRLVQDDLGGDRAFALVDRSGNISQCSQAFEAIVRRGDVFTLSARKLAAKLARHRPILNSFLGQLSAVSPPLAPPPRIRLAADFGQLGYVIRGVRFAPDLPPAGSLDLM